MGGKVEKQSETKVFGGWNRRYKHDSSVLGCSMTFTVYFPSGSNSKLPVLYYLSGLTCNDENVIQKSGCQRAAAQHGIAFVAPDTSPRGLSIEGEDESWDFGSGAGFYLNATQDKWKQYRMYDYITKELPEVLGQFDELDTSNAAITGHSMGGHGALVIGLRNPEQYKSISAFAPICHPVQVPWGEKAFGNYLGSNKEEWKQYDATKLAKSYKGPQRDILIDQGSKDNFLQNQLQPEHFEKAAAGNQALQCTLRMQEGYDHSYFFMASFMDDHIAHAAKHLK
ncbi:hypothetical protein WJX73_000375 [Symbiochloris irregularis]|uniref:S-formylglutathione hydrolase n=1 Tax=Symbiochloris irregularis TaxID=706552 RepID=A0AAW1NU71_9CHLO